MKIFGFIKKLFFVGLTILSSFTNANLLSCVSMNNQECKQDHKLLMLMLMSLCFFHLVLKQVDCNNINYLYAKICLPDVAKNLDVKVFNLIS